MPATGPSILAQTPDAEHETDRETTWSEVALISPSTSPPENDATVPVWIHRLHGDGLPASRAGAATPRWLDSQRVVKRWKGAAGGY